MKGDQLTWHWDIPAAHPYAKQIDFAFREGFAGSDKPKIESDAAGSAFATGVAARAELHDESRRFAELRVYLSDDAHVAYELTEKS